MNINEIINKLAYKGVNNHGEDIHGIVSKKGTV